MDSYLKIVVLKELAKKPMSGYSLMKCIKEDTGTYKPSAGSIYPLLSQLKKLEIVDFKQDKKQKVYFLTTFGKKHYQQIQKKKETIISTMVAKVKMCENLSTDESAAVYLDILKHANGVGFPKKIINEMGPEVLQLRKEVARIYIQGKLKSNKTKVRTILAQTIKQLKKI